MSWSGCHGGGEADGHCVILFGAAVSVAVIVVAWLEELISTKK
jgi:hypothetical protein